MNFSSIINHSAQLFEIVWNSNRTAETIVANFLRQKKYIGSNDRKFISEIVFASLRTKLTGDYCIDSIKHKTDFAFINQNQIRVLTVILQSIGKLNPIADDKVNLNQKKLIDTDAICQYYKIDSSDDFLSFLISSFCNLLSIDESLFNDLLANIQDTLAELELSFFSNISLLSSGELRNIDFSVLQAYSSMPEYLLKKFSENRDIIHSLNIAQSCKLPAKVCLRIASSDFNIDSIIAQFKTEGISSERGKLSPVCIVLEKRPNIINHPLYKNGIIELQDEGSQLIAYALDPDQNDSVLDACAGAGGKTLHIASLQNDKGNISASDIDLNKLKELMRRSHRFGYKSIKTILINKNSRAKLDFFSDTNNGFDCILVDAPCSGSGTFRRNPKQKYLLNPTLVKKLSDNQSRILAFYSQFVRPGGLLVYATCSLLKDENEDVVENFLKAHRDFLKDPLMPVFCKYGIELPGLIENDYCFTLDPFTHKTDGFFIARMKRCY